MDEASGSLIQWHLGALTLNDLVPTMLCGGDMEQHPLILEAGQTVIGISQNPLKYLMPHVANSCQRIIFGSLSKKHKYPCTQFHSFTSVYKEQNEKKTHIKQKCEIDQRLCACPPNGQ